MSNSSDYFNGSVTDNVEKLLRERPETRDEDSKLVANYYYYFQADLVKGKTAEEFLKALGRNELVSSDLITRTRRKLQEHNPDLRGKVWEERQERRESVKEETRNVGEFKRPKQPKPPKSAQIKPTNKRII